MKSISKSVSLFSCCSNISLRASLASFGMAQAPIRLLQSQLCCGFPVVIGVRSSKVRNRTPLFVSLRNSSSGECFQTESKLLRDRISPRSCLHNVLASSGLFGGKNCWNRARFYNSLAVASNEADAVASDDLSLVDNEVKKESKPKRKKKTKSDESKPASSITAADSEELPLKEDIDTTAPLASKRKVKKKTTASEPKKDSENEKISAKKGTAELMNLKLIKKGSIKPLYPPTGKAVMVVESLTKAKAIQNYLGDQFEVLPSYGHVRDLASRSGSVRPDDEFSMVWEVPSAAWTHLKTIKVALSGAQSLILASDPDREGEAIAWHISEMLQQQGALRGDLTVARVVFHEITESSVKTALMTPRDIDANLVYAYLARRALDYLIGFNISPLLWRKLPGCQSAGRVQSAALSLVCDREAEIDVFKPQEYWSVEVQLKGKTQALLHGHLTHFSDAKLNQFSITSEKEALEIENDVMKECFAVISSKTSKASRTPPTPYITSTLQQDASNRLDFSTMQTMKVAQKLYEGVALADGKITGLITYMRTDGLHISNAAVQEIRSFVANRYGDNFAEGGLVKYSKKVKNAQEAHEAIRPTNINLLPSMLTEVLEDEALKLYTMIWCRTVACQMKPAIFEQVQVDVADKKKMAVFRSSCSSIAFPGYRAVYEDVEAQNYKNIENTSNAHIHEFEALKSLNRGDPLEIGNLEKKQHFTQAPPRFSEGSLVKKLEELGIGRPSTYASTIKVLKDRNYITMKSRTLHPEFRGRMVSAFLSQHFTEVTDYGFTANMETELDNVSAGSTEWKSLLYDYWRRFKSHCNRTENVTIHQVEKMLEGKFGDFLFRALPFDSRKCPSCSVGTLTFKVSRYGDGYFIGCDQHPNCKYIAKTFYGEEEAPEEEPISNKFSTEPKFLGLHPGTNEKVMLKFGPFGSYLQLGEGKKGYPPKRASVARIKEGGTITLEEALEALRYPITVGNHPEDGKPITLSTGRNGFLVKHRRTIVTLKKNMSPDDLTVEKALELLNSDKARKIGRPKASKKAEAA